MAGKTGGGRGSNQHRIRGVSNSLRGQNNDPGAKLVAPSNVGKNWAELLAQFPTFPGEYQAVPEPQWHDLSSTLRGVSSKGSGRAVERYIARESNSLYNDAKLEGFAFTEPDIVTLLNGGHVAGHTVGEEAQVVGLKQASDYMLNCVDEGNAIEPGQNISDDLHVFIGASLGIASLAFRGNQDKQHEGPRVRLGGGEEFRALDARITPAVLEAGLARIRQIEHPVVRGATWAAFAAYQQFYLDGNKRTGRYVMNTVLMSHGYDAILIPANIKAQYEDVLVEGYKSGDLTSHIKLLLDLYPKKD